MRPALLTVGAIVVLVHSDPLSQDKVGSKLMTANHGSLSAKRVEELKVQIQGAFEGLQKTQIQIAGAVKGSTAVGAVVTETKSDLAIVRDPCKAESAKRPIVFENPYVKKTVGAFVCANNKRYEKVEVEQR